MGYIFLFIALIAGGTKGFCGKKVSGIVNGFRDTLVVNCLRMLVCIVIGILVLVVQGEMSALLPEAKLLWLAAAGGIFTTAFVISWLYAVRQNAYMLVEIFLMLGVIVTVGMSFFVFGEPVSIREAVGILILLAAIATMQMQRVRIKLSTVLIMILCGTVNGLADFSQKAYMKSAEGASVAAFQLYTYVFSALSMILFLSVMAIVGARKRQAGYAEVSDKNEMVLVVRKTYKYMLIMSLCLYLNSYFKTMAAGVLPAALMYPLMQGASLMISTLMAVILLKEKLTLRMLCGIVMAFVALLVINW